MSPSSIILPVPVPVPLPIAAFSISCILYMRCRQHICAAHVHSSCFFRLILILTFASYEYEYRYAHAYHHAPNPRAVHPQGRLPSMFQAKNKFAAIQQEIYTMMDDSNINTNTNVNHPTYTPTPTIVLVDGNNIRSSYGFQSMSATGLTKELSYWSEYVYGNGNGNVNVNVNVKASNDQTAPASTLMPQVICVWDGGDTRFSQQSNNILSVFSGTDGNADDLIVQCCSFLSSSSSSLLPSCTISSSTRIFQNNLNRNRGQDEDSHQNQNMNMNILVFTSDANLANRCKMQIMDGNRSAAATATATAGVTIDTKIYHSIYLHLLLDYCKHENGDGNGNGDHVHDSNLNTFNPDWEREERRQSVKELQQCLLQNTSAHASESTSESKSKSTSTSISFQEDECKHESMPMLMNCICEWINDGLEGIAIGRVTKGGSILYQVENKDCAC